MKQIAVAEFHKALRGQGVSSRDHAAVKCIICGTVQSIASLVKAGAEPEAAERKIGFACEGRVTGAGPWPAESSKSKKSEDRRKVRGCDWTLGGLFRIHKLEIVTDDGEKHPMFEIATPEEAQTLEAWLKANKEVPAS